MKYLYYTLLVTAITITSCKNNETTTVQARPTNVVPFWQQSTPVAPGQSTQASGTQGPNLAGINPPHGQANHRCDIAIGAPLNAAVNGVTSIQSTQAVASPQNVTAKTVTLKGMNPPHGDSGHRCDIAVGAPLNSKPAVSATTAVTNSVQETNEYSVQQAVPALLSTDTDAAAGINPAHGKTGHRCDIAVGVALPKS